jgi:hypothetical protein
VYGLHVCGTCKHPKQSQPRPTTREETKQQQIWTTFWYTVGGGVGQQNSRKKAALTFLSILRIDYRQVQKMRAALAAVAWELLIRDSLFFPALTAIDNEAIHVSAEAHMPTRSRPVLRSILIQSGLSFMTCSRADSPRTFPMSYSSLSVPDNKASCRMVGLCHSLCRTVGITTRTN